MKRADAHRIKMSVTSHQTFGEVGLPGIRGSKPITGEIRDRNFTVRFRHWYGVW